MNVGKYIYAKLGATAGVTALVSTRIYPVLLPQNCVFPAVVYTSRTTPNDSQKTQSANHDREAVTFRVWADVQQGEDGYTSVQAIEAAIRAALDFVSATAGGVQVDHCHFDSSDDVVAEDRLLLGRELNYTFIVKR